MTANETKRASTGKWTSIAPELRPSAFKNTDGSLKPFYLARKFEATADNTFELTIVNSADPFGKVPLVEMIISGTMQWLGDHPVANGAQKVNFTADRGYTVTTLNQGFTDVLNKIASNGFETWQTGVAQNILKKSFAPFGLAEGQVFMEYDLIYVFNDMMFWGARNVDGRGFETEANRPTNLQIPMRRA